MNTQFRTSLSRRSFLHSLGAASFAATSLPGIAAVAGPTAPQLSRGAAGGDKPLLSILADDDMVSISMNENPLGPPQSALNAIAETAQMGNRYHGEVIQSTVSTAIDLFGMKRGYVGLFAEAVDEEIGHLERAHGAGRRAPHVRLLPDVQRSRRGLLQEVRLGHEGHGERGEDRCGGMRRSRGSPSGCCP